MTDPEINRVYRDIQNQISKIYGQYEYKSRQMKEQANKQSGSIVEKAESQLFRKIETILEPQLQKLIAQMEKVKILKGKFSGPVKQCHTFIKSILKRKSFNFKMNKLFNQLYEETLNSIQVIRKKIPQAEKTSFLCCGTDGQKQTEAIINLFKIQSGRWEMISTLQPKGTVDNFICPQYNQTDYDFIKDLLKASWPKQIIRQIQLPQPPPEKIYLKGGPNLLDEANQFLLGVNREQNILKGLSIYLEEADKKDNQEAMAFLGKVYEEGLLLPKNLAKSASYYKKGMDRKHKYASYRFAMCLIKSTFTKDKSNREKKVQEIKQAYSILRDISSGQDPCPQALAEIGMLYQNGFFSVDLDRIQVENVDQKKAIAYNEKAKSFDLPRAMNNLGLIYYGKAMASTNPKEKLDSQNARVQMTKKALGYFEQAEKHGFPQAYYNIAMIHKEAKSSQKFIQAFYSGARKGDYLCKIKFAYELMNQTSIVKECFEEHYRLAQYWLEEAIQYLNSLEADGGSADTLRKILLEKAEAMFYMGLFNEYGFGIQKSPKRAFNYFLQASQLSYGPAKNKIGDCYFSGYAVPINRQLAIGCYLQAQTLGDSDAMVNLGTIYLNGIPNVIERNYSKAHEYFCKAMELQNSDAMIHLSYMYRNGLGLQVDDQLAKKLLQEAAKNKNSTALYMLKEQGFQFNKNIYYENLQTEFLASPKRIDISEIIPAISAI